MPFVQTTVPGLWLCEDFLTIEKELDLLTAIDQQPWKSNRQGTRRVQMYGPHHDQRFRVWKDSPITPLPAFAADVVKSILDLATDVLPEHYYLFELENNRLTELFVNEYGREAELQFHTDHNLTYEEAIVGISLWSDAALRFREVGTGKFAEHIVDLPRRSCYLMTGRSRTEFQHGMLPGDCHGDRRVSLTFRVVSAANILSRR